MKKLIIVTLVVASFFLAGCTESYSSPGTHVNHHYKPSTSQGLQALGELSYQAGGKSVSPQKYNDNMNALGALGILMDITGSR